MAEENVFLFVPNLIGYARIILAILSCLFMPSHYVLAVMFYLLSQLMDALDGHAARYFNQSSRFGAMLDQLTDRCSTLCLFMILGQFYPRAIFLFQMTAVIDIASHWLHLHSHDIGGSTHYKQIAVSGNLTKLLHFYYTSRPFLFFMCAGNESFYCLLYLTHFTTGPLNIFIILMVISLPIAVVKTGISIVHLIQASQNVVEIDLKERKERVE